MFTTYPVIYVYYLSCYLCLLLILLSVFTTYPVIYVYYLSCYLCLLLILLSMFTTYPVIYVYYLSCYLCLLLILLFMFNTYPVIYVYYLSCYPLLVVLFVLHRSFLSENIVIRFEELLNERKEKNYNLLKKIDLHRLLSSLAGIVISRRYCNPLSPQWNWLYNI